MNDFWANAIWSLAPTVLIGLIFWFVMRAILRADRTERAAYAQIEAEERAKLGIERRLERRPERTAD
jgi:flagellar biosynthesis/type III secretory pathway M-ring protein FliF/YscJ